MFSGIKLTIMFYRPKLIYIVIFASELVKITRINRKNCHVTFGFLVQFTREHKNFSYFFFSVNIIQKIFKYQTSIPFKTPLSATIHHSTLPKNNSTLQNHQPTSLFSPNISSPILRPCSGNINSASPQDPIRRLAVH